MKRALFLLVVLPAIAQQPQKIAEGVSVANGAAFVGVEGLRWHAQNSGSPYSLRLEKGVYRFELHPDDHWPHDVLESSHPKNRSEISGDALVPIVGRSRISYDVMLEKAGLSSPRQFHILGQRHATKDADDAPGESPTIALQIETGGVPSLRVVGSAEQPLVHKPSTVEGWVGTPADFELGKWHTVVIEANTNPSTTEGAYVDLWLDGKWRKAEGAAHTYTGQLGYVNAKNDYWKFGDYAWAGMEADAVVWFRNIKLDVMTEGHK